MTSINGHWKTWFAECWYFTLKLLTLCHQNVCQGWYKSRTHSLVVAWGRNPTRRSASFVSQERLAFTVFGGKEVEMDCYLPNAASICACISYRRHLILALCGIMDPALCLYSSEAYCNKYECLPVKMIQPFVLCFRRMFFIQCGD